MNHILWALNKGFDEGQLLKIWKIGRMYKSNTLRDKLESIGIGVRLS